MKLTSKQIEKLKRVDIIKTTRDARLESSRILNDQGFAVLSLAISHFIVDIAERPEKLVKEFTR